MHNNRAKRPIKLTPERIQLIEAEVKIMLHASRDCLRDKYDPNDKRSRDPRKVTFSVNCGYYGEAFGIMRAVRLFFGMDFGAVNVPGNLNSWFHRLQDEVLAEEGFGKDGKCAYCMKHYHKDDSDLPPANEG